MKFCDPADYRPEETSPWEVRTRPPRKRRHRKITMASIARDMRKAGLGIAKVEVAPDGVIAVCVGKVAEAVYNNSKDIHGFNGIDAAEWN